MADETEKLKREVTRLQRRVDELEAVLRTIHQAVQHGLPRRGRGYVDPDEVLGLIQTRPRLSRQEQARQRAEAKAKEQAERRERAAERRSKAIDRRERSKKPPT